MSLRWSTLYVSCYAGRMLKGYSEFGEPYGGKVRTRLGGDGASEIAGYGVSACAAAGCLLVRPLL